MKNFKIIFVILMILFKTGNVLSKESIFIVNNIKVDKDSFKNKEELINTAFKKGFLKLNNKILLEEDFIKIKDTNIRNIKNLVSHYQIVKNDDEKMNEISLINLFFKRDKMYDFYSKNNIRYSDVSGKIVKILPVLIKEEEIFVYDNNFFYNNWISVSKEKTNENIEYIFPLEDLETIELIKKNQNNLENIKLDDIFEKDNQTDNILLIIDFNKKKTNFFLKGKISSKKIIKNFVMVNKIDNEIKYSEILAYLKKEILEIIKSQNIIDVGTPSFLNVTLSVDKQSDLFLFQNILSEVDLIESFSVMEFNNKFAYVKIKYYGKINKLREKLIEKKLTLDLVNNQWNAKVK